MYDFIISVYAGLVRLAQYFNPKARLMVEGHQKIFDVLKQNISPSSKYIWIHAASLGEFEQGRPVLEQIKKDYPEYKILLTFFSPSGYEVRKNYPMAETICYLPFDTRRNVVKFLETVNPKMAIFIKYEFWYNYLTELHKRQIPTYIVSAIFRPSQLFFKWYGKRARKVLKYYEQICVQNVTSKNLLKQVGVDNVTVCGDTRFDRVKDVCSQLESLPLVERFVSKETKTEQTILVAGSTWTKDEEVLIPYFNTSSGVKLIIAPHEIHDSHLIAIEKSLKRPFVRYSQLEGKDPLDFDCIIIDCFGLLSSIYRYGKVAYIGGGFGSGIHNVLEAAVYGIPVVFGPNYQKFREAVQLIECGGAFSINGSEDFVNRLNRFIHFPEEFSVAGKRAGEYVTQNAKAVEKVMIELQKHLHIASHRD